MAAYYVQPCARHSTAQESEAGNENPHAAGSTEVFGRRRQRQIRPLFKVALWTGMRPEEYLGLQWKDVDFSEGTITVLRAMLFNHKGGGWYFKEPKTAQSRRTIPIPAHLVSQLKRHRRKQLEERK